MYPPPAGPPPRRRPRAGVIAAAVVALVLVAVGVTVYVQVRSSEGPSVATLRQFLDRVPLPAGATLTDESSTAADLDNSAYLERRYRLTTSAPGTQLRALLGPAGFRVVDGRNHVEEPVSSPIWSTYAAAGSGDVYLRFSGRPSGMLEMQWTNALLVLTVTGSDVG